MNEPDLVSIYACDSDLMKRARSIDPEAFAAVNTTRHCGTSARRISAINAARAELANETA